MHNLGDLGTCSAKKIPGYGGLRLATTAAGEPLVGALDHRPDGTNQEIGLFRGDGRRVGTRSTPTPINADLEISLAPDAAVTIAPNTGQYCQNLVGIFSQGPE